MKIKSKQKNNDLAIHFFLILIIIRPVIDVFWWVKDINPFLSPLNWFGFLPLIIILHYLVKSRIVVQIAKNEWINRKELVIFLLFSFLTFINAAALFLKQIIHFNETTVLCIGIVAKILAFPLFFFFTLSFVNQENFNLLMKVFLLSTFFPILMMIYEVLVIPINPYIPGGREFERYRGFYADGINYMIYLFISLVTSGYLYLIESDKRKINTLFFKLILSRKIPYLAGRNLIFSFVIFSPYFFLLCIIFCFSTIFLFYLHQGVAYFVYVFVFLLILIFVYKKNKFHFFTLSLFLTSTIIFLYIPNLEKLASLFYVDTEILKGNIEIVHGANGRVLIWLNGLKQITENSFYCWFFGAGITGYKSLKYLSAGAHSDYLRILYSAGITGLFFYLSFVIRIFKGFTSLPHEFKFLLLSLIGTLLLFSVTHTPTVYLPFVYFFSTILAKSAYFGRFVHNK